MHRREGGKPWNIWASSSLVGQTWADGPEAVDVLGRAVIRASCWASPNSALLQALFTPSRFKLLSLSKFLTTSNHLFYLKFLKNIIYFIIMYI